jgi:hypothetical protein
MENKMNRRVNVRLIYGIVMIWPQDGEAGTGMQISCTEAQVEPDEVLKKRNKKSAAKAKFYNEVPIFSLPAPSFIVKAPHSLIYYVDSLNSDC